jgi:outer membrane protein assembly factor BamB
MNTPVRTLLALGLAPFLFAGCRTVVSPAPPRHATLQSEDSVRLIGTADGLAAPESVAYDRERNLLYVSVQAGSVPGDGSIAKLSLEGKLLDADYVVGLNDPKGVAVGDGRLYVANGTELVEVELRTGAILHRHTAAGIEFLNDVTIDRDGNVYVAEMFGSAIFRLDRNRVFGEWIRSAELENPNGLLAVGDELFVAGWGRFTDGKPLGAPPGRFLKVDLQSKTITRITAGPVGNLDGLQVNDSKSFVLSDWKAGVIYRVSRQGVVVPILKTDRGVGDILFLREHGLLILPMKMQNQIRFYRVK